MRPPGLLVSIRIASLRRLALVSTLVASLTTAAGVAAAAEDGPRYNRDIRPILAENCFACHGPDSAARKADLRLDRREDALKTMPSGSAAIVPGNLDESELVFRIEEADESVAMPPPDSHKTLTAAQKDLLKKWIAAGAEYQPHWSFLAPERTEPPAVQNAGWVRNPIDRFVLAGLEKAGLSPAPEADRPTLARRAALDLTGLPPEPALVAAFLADPAPDAYERYVDRLLDAPAWGEHRARYWLDAARYADTHGYHFDNFREMWTYRDWVIDAFNRNLPFDRFTVDQLAGDLLPDATLDQKIASGFNRCNMSTNEGGTIPEENLVIYMKDRTDTAAAVWLGLTANCASCHDHKFDPLSQREYYELAAFFNNTTQSALDGNVRDTAPTVFVPTEMDRPRWDGLQAELADARSKAEARKAAARAEFDAWLGAATPEKLDAMTPTADLAFRARVAPRDPAPANPGAVPTLEIAGAGDFEKDQPFTIAAWVRPSKAGLTGALAARMDDASDYRGWDFWLDGGRAGSHIVSKWPDDALKVVAETPLPEGQWTHVAVRYDGSGKASGVSVAYNGEPQKTRVLTDALKSTIRTGVPFKVGQRNASSRLTEAAVNDLRLYARGLDNTEVAALAGASRGVELLARAADQRPAPELDALYDWWLREQDPASRDLRTRLAALEQEESALRARGSVAHVAQERGEPAMAYVLFRGEYDKRRDEVHPDTPDILPPLSQDAPRNRLGLAQWLVTPENPLTARVSVNRFWQEVFGTGLVRTAGDFGVSGELPSHPELLDWLAVEFREGGWDVKRLFRLMLTSAAYRQAALATPEKVEKDPQNRLLSRGPRFRMDAEMVRDYALAACGLLTEEQGGPSVRPYQPEGVWEAVAMPESNTRSYKADEGDRLYRRSLYTFWKRAAPPALMDIFNAPSRETCTVRRERTNTPLQALATLNDPTFVEAARHLAERALREGGDSPTTRIEFLARHLLARSFRPEELSVVENSLADLSAYYRDHAEDAAKLIAVGASRADPALDVPTLAAWTMLANQLMNLDEVLNK